MSDTNQPKIFSSKVTTKIAQAVKPRKRVASCCAALGIAISSLSCQAFGQERLDSIAQAENTTSIFADGFESGNIFADGFESGDVAIVRRSRSATAIAATPERSSGMLSMFASGNAFSQGRLQTVAQRGDSTSNGTIGSGIDGLQLNNNGQVAFRGTLEGITGGAATGNGLFLWSGSLQEIARDGDSTSDGNFGQFSNIQLNDQGQVSFVSPFITGSSLGVDNNAGLFFYDGGSIEEVVRESESAPNSGTLDTFVNVSLSNSGRTAFESRIDVGAVVTVDSVFSFNGTSLQEIARAGDATQNGSLDFINSVGTSNAGTVFFGGLNGTSGGANDDEAIFFSPGTGFAEIARKGDATGNGTLGSLTNTAQINNAGQVSFVSSSLQGTVGGANDDSAVFISDGPLNPLREIIREGYLTSDGEVSGFRENHLNDAGQLAVRVNLRNTSSGGSSEDALLLYNGTGIEEYARKGDATANGSLANILDFRLNNNGQVAYNASLVGTAGGNAALDSRATFLTDGIETLEIRRGGEIASGLTISTFDAPEINDLGQVALRLFTTAGENVVELFTPDLNWRSAGAGDWDDVGNWTLSIAPGVVHDVSINSVADLTVNGPTVDTQINQLELGNGTGTTTLNLQAGSVLTAVNNTTIGTNGILTGSGTLSGTVNNLGEVRVATGQSLKFDQGLFINNVGGVVENISGVAEFDNLVINATGGEIFGVDSSFRFDGGLVNDGLVGLSFGTIHELFGDVTNNADGVITLAGGSQVTFFDDVVQNGILEISDIGAADAAAVVFGEFSGDGGFVGGGELFALGGLNPGNSTASVLFDGDLFLGSARALEIELGGLAAGEFDQLLVSGDFSANGDLLVELVNGFELESGQEFLIADVGGVLEGELFQLSEGELVGSFGGQDLFISFQAGDGNDIRLFTAVSAVPEPGSAVLVAAGLALLGCRRRRR